MVEKEKRIKEIEKEIKRKVKQYVDAQKRYNGDSALSKRLEAEVDSLEVEKKILLGVI